MELKERLSLIELSLSAIRLIAVTVDNELERGEIRSREVGSKKTLRFT